MRKRIRIVIPVLAVLALVISAFALAVPAAAVECDVIPEGADTNFIAIGITVPPGTYYVGDTMYYTVNVLVPATSGGFAPAQQTNIDVYLLLPGGVKGVDDVFLGTIATLDPGASHAFAPYAYVIDAADMVEMGGGQVVTAEAWCAGTAMLCPRVDSNASVEIAVPVVEEELIVSKTVVTSYTRTHEWDIEKWVETELGYFVDGGLTPKIWLYPDSSGDEAATWHVCVTYLGYEDSDFNVSGTVTIENTGTADAVITGVEDLLCGTPIDVDFGGVIFPITLPVGWTLNGMYDEDVAGMLVDCDNVVTVTTEVDMYGTSEPIIWGDPDEEFLDVVNVVDDSEFLADPHLGTLYAADYVAGDEVCFDYDHFFAWADYFAPGPYIYENIATIVETGQWDDAILKVNWEQPGNEGCTPGFWKNNAVKWEAVAWLPTGYLPGDSFESVFGVSDITLRGKGKDMIENPTLLEALGANGGGINALARHAVAALLNISHPDIAYAGGMSVCALQLAVQNAVAMDGEAIEALHTQLADYNEAGCSINQHGEPIILDGG